MRNENRARLLLALAAVIVSACSSTPDVSDEARLQLAPTGTLRVGLNMGNALLTAKDPAGGEQGAANAAL